MIIQDGLNKREGNIGRINVGDTFVYDEQYYIKIHEDYAETDAYDIYLRAEDDCNSYANYFAVNLITGELMAFEPDTIVELYDFKISIIQ